MTYEPLGARVVLSITAPIEKTSGGILMPGVLQETLHTAPVEATVTAIGPDVTELKVGDVVLVPKGAGTEASDEDGTKHVVILEEEILGAF